MRSIQKLIGRRNSRRVWGVIAGGVFILGQCCKVDHCPASVFMLLRRFPPRQDGFLWGWLEHRCKDLEKDGVAVEGKWDEEVSGEDGGLVAVGR